jgi:hypothetical protein
MVLATGKPNRRACGWQLEDAMRSGVAQEGVKGAHRLLLQGAGGEGGRRVSLLRAAAYIRHLRIAGSTGVALMAMD